MRNQKVFIVIFLFILFFAKFTCNAQDLTTLQNGLTLITEERNQPPLVYFLLTVKTGSIYEGEYLGTGISHFVEHMVFKEREQPASPKSEQNGEEMSSFAKKIESMGGELNAYTSLDNTSYYVLVPSSKWEEGLEILFDAVLNPSFDEKEMEKEREVILREMALSEDNPSRFLSKYFFKNFYTLHPYKFPVIGKRMLFMGLQPDDLAKYHKRMYVPNNMILVVCGNIDKEKVESRVIEIHQNIHPSPLVSIVLPKEPPQLFKKEFALEKDINMAYLSIGFHIPPFADEDMYALDILSIILGQGKSSRLYQRLREEESLVHSISSYSWTPLYHGIFGISAVMEESNIEKVKEIIFEEIQKIQDRSIKEKELDKAINILKMQELSTQETLDTRASELASNYIYTQDLEFSSKYLKRIEKVTKEKIVQVARKYLTTNNSTTGTLISTKAATKIKELSKKISEHPSKEILGNRLTLILRENQLLPLVSITAIMGGGLIIENEENNGICNLFSSMLLKGTKNRAYTDIIDSIEFLGGKITTFPGNNTFGIRINVNSEDIDTALDILADILLNSNFPKDELNKEKNAQIMQITREKDSIFTYGLNNLRKHFFDKHPYALNLSGEIPTVSSIERKDMFRLKDKLIVGVNTVISVSGDFDKNKIKKKIENIFSSLPKGNKVEGGYPQTFQNKQIDLEGKWKQSVLFISFPAPNVKNDDFCIMEVLSSYLNGMNSPLFLELRNKKALAYTTGAFTLSGWDPGLFAFYIATKKEKLEESLLGMQEEIRKLKKGDFSENDIESAKKKLLTQKWKNLQDNESFAFELALAELYNLGYEEPLRLAERISGITKKDIILFANKYFNEDKSTVLILEGI